MPVADRDAELAYGITHQGDIPDPPEWWRGAVFYEVYLPSFRDTTGNGIGDLKGITERLDHISSVGAEAIWVSPFFPSPQKDDGYDVTDHMGVYPPYGTLDDVKHLIAEAHARDLKIMSDFILGHTSDQHPWFEESRQSTDNPKADWYVWANPAPDGTAPTNWLSSFSGRAWRWEPKRAQYVYTPFLESQPALNLKHPEVMDRMEEALRFWLELGFDGFRLDAIQCLSYDLSLRDNPSAPARQNPSVGGGPNNPFKHQMHIFDRDVPEALQVIEKVRKIAESFTPERVLIGELADVDSSRLAPKYTSDHERLHAVYDFELINRMDDLAEWKRVLDTRSHYLQPGRNLTVFTNHDSPRAVSNLMPHACATGHRREAAKVLLFLQATLMGGVILFQGDELGLEQPEISPDDIRDPWALALWPDFEGRDGVRCPIPWERDAKNCGFTDSDTPFRKIPDIHRDLAVDRQNDDPHSVLNFTRDLFAWRRPQKLLRIGEQRMIQAVPKEIVAFERTTAEDYLYCVANLGTEQISIEIPKAGLCPAFSCGSIDLQETSLSLGPLACAALCRDGG